MPKQITDLSTKTFGIYTVLEQDIETSNAKKRVYWKCRCNKCNNETSVRGDGLTRLPKNCPNCRYPNLTGKQYGLLTVLEKGKTDKNGHVYWICQCQCGTIKEIAGSNLTQGTQSCGCLQSKIASETHLLDLTGQKFGKLTVLQKTSTVGDKRVKWLCKCDCGTQIEVQSNNLTNGHTQSCGCIKSLGELKIREILLSNKILFKTEYIFSDLSNRRFDFAVFDNNGNLSYLIEFDGKQHFDYIKTWHHDEDSFLVAQQRDKEKTNYCKEKNIPLIRIPYWGINNITMDYIKNKVKEAQGVKEGE